MFVMLLLSYLLYCKQAIGHLKTKSRLLAKGHANSTQLATPMGHSPTSSHVVATLPTGMPTTASMMPLLQVITRSICGGRVFVQGPKVYNIPDSLPMHFICPLSAFSGLYFFFLGVGPSFTF
jgi:hypothetical protein